MSKQRVCIYAKDVGVLLGRSYKQAVRIHCVIRDAYGKKKWQYLTIEEFSAYTGISIDIVRKYCDDR